jgi:Peptidase family M23
MVDHVPTTPASHWIAALLPALVAAVLPAGAAGAWLPPVPGAPTRAFDLGADPFAPGQHRGADLAAPAGATVRAPCTGQVAVAGRVGTSGRVVTLLCGQWRVTHLPLATITVDPGETAARGDTLGTVAHSTDHAGLHLGVRRDGDRFAYTDPLPFLGRDRVPPPAVPAPRPTHRPRPPRAPAPIHRPLPTAEPLRAPDAKPVRVPAGGSARAPAAEPRTAARPTQSMPAVGSAVRDAAAGAERTAAEHGPPWTLGVGLLLTLAAFARRPRRRARPEAAGSRRQHRRVAHPVAVRRERRRGPAAAEVP